MKSHRVGIVVPTLGERIDFLKIALTSIRNAGLCHISIVCPNPNIVIREIDTSLFDSVILDPRRGLAAAINEGIKSLPLEISYVNWLGDDDVLCGKALEIASAILDANQHVVLVYGNCDYISEAGVVLWRNRPRKLASLLLHFGPQLVPQPGSLFRRAMFMECGLLNTEFKYAFDLDLLLRLKKKGRLCYVDFTFAKFRWHSGSLSVAYRKSSVYEASQIRQQFVPRSLRLVAVVWEIPMTLVIRLAGSLLNAKLYRLGKNSRTNSS